MKKTYGKQRKAGWENRNRPARWTGLLLILAMALSAAGCGREPAQEAPAVASVVMEQRFVQDYSLGQDVEFAVVTGYDDSENRVWTYVTENYELGQADQVSQILQTEDRYYLCEGGTVVALDLSTGAVLWKNEEFGGSVPRGCLGEDGTLYLCGYWGPDFFAVTPEGETAGSIRCFDEDFYWANHIEMSGDKVAVSLENGPMDLRTEAGFVFLVDPEDLSYDLINDVG